MMKKIDKIVLAVFVLAMVILCFFQRCSLDIYFLILAFAVAIMAAYTMYKQNKNSKKEEQQ